MSGAVQSRDRAADYYRSEYNSAMGSRTPARPAGKHFLLYWQPRWVDYHLQENRPLECVGSYHFQRVRAGDTVWIVTVARGRLYLAARILASEVLSRRAASERTGKELHGRYYAFAKKRTAQKARRIDITRAAGRLRFASIRDRLDAGNPRLWAMQLQTMRVLAPASALLLERAWRF